MNGENRKSRVRAPQNNPLPAPRRTGRDDEDTLNETGASMAEDGYTVLDRAPLSRYNRERRGLGVPVADNDGPDDDYGRYGYLP